MSANRVREAHEGKRRPAKEGRPSKRRGGRVAKKPATNKPTTNKPTTNKPTANKPTRRRSAATLVGVSAPGYLGAVLSVVIAFAGAAFLYRSVFEHAANAAAETPEAEAVQDGVEEEPQAGVPDTWRASGRFNTGNDSLNINVKSFCDALSTPDSTALQNAQAAYNAIVLGEYTPRSAEENPEGPDWDLVAARQYFETANPEYGEPGQGDIYDQVAATTFCLLYFGFDAVSIPTITDGVDSALCLVTDETGYERVCDPAFGTGGWMLDRYQYSIVVNDIGQDLGPAEARGLTVERHNRPTATDDGGYALEEGLEEAPLGYDEYGNPLV